MNREEMLNKFLSMLERQKFAEWYTKGRFEQWLSGEDPELERKDLLKDLSEMVG